MLWFSMHVSLLTAFDVGSSSMIVGPFPHVVFVHDLESVHVRAVASYGMARPSQADEVSRM
jgi:hypothetical protein